MKRVDWYILSEMFSPFVFGLCIFGSLWLANLLIRMVNLFVTKGVALQAVAEIFLYSVPAIALTTLPMAVLLAALLSLGRMSGDSEITALKACGVGFGRIVLPMLLLGAIVSLVAFWFQEKVVPAANRRRERVFINEVVLKKPLPKIAKDIFFDGGDEFKMFVRNYNPAEERMLDVTMYQFQRKAFPVVTEAREAQIQNDIWTFRNGRIVITTEKDGRMLEEIYFDKWEYPIKSRHAERVKKVNPSEKEMNMVELYKKIRAHEKKGLPVRRMWVEFWFKSAFPFANIFLVLLGAPLAVGSSRSGGTSIGIGLSILIMFVYYCTIALGKALGDAGTLSPLVGAWCPNLLAGIAAIFLVRRAIRS